MYTARYLGVDGFGELSFALAFTGLFGIFIDFGLNTLIVREVARDNMLAGKYLLNVIGMKALLSVITIIMIAFTINFLDYSNHTMNIIYIVALSVIFNSFSGIFYSIFQAYEKLAYQSFGMILNSVLLLAGVMVAISQDFDVFGFAYIYFIVSIILLGYTFVVNLKKFVFPKIEIDFGFWKHIIKQALPLALIGIFVTINQRIDRIMLSSMIDMTSVGVYSAASNLILVLEFIPAAYIMSIYPFTSRLHSSKKQLEFILERSIKYMSMIGFPIGVGTTLLADRIIFLIYGQEYFPSISALQILIWSNVIIFVAILFNNLLISTNKQALVSKQIGIVAVANIIMNFILIPEYSYIGASIATVMSSLIGFIILYYSVSKNGYSCSTALISSIMKMIISCSIMAIYIFIFNELNLFVLIFSSALIYFIVLWATKIFDDVDVELFGSIIKLKQNQMK